MMTGYMQASKSPMGNGINAIEATSNLLYPSRIGQSTSDDGETVGTTLGRDDYSIFVETLRSLSPEECEIIRLTALGYTAKGIAYALNYNVRTINRRFETDEDTCLYNKIVGVGTKPQLAAWWGDGSAQAVANLDVFPARLDTLDTRRRLGDSGAIARETARAITVLRSYLDRHPLSPLRPEILKRIFELLWVRGFSIFDTEPSVSALAHVRPIITSLKDISEELGDRQPLAFSYVLSGTGAMRDKNPAAVLQYSQEALKLVNAIEVPYYQLTVCRHIAYSSAALRGLNGAISGEVILERRLNGIPGPTILDEMRSLEIRGVARGRAGHDSSMEYLTAALDVCHTISPAELPMIEKVRIMWSIIETSFTLGVVDKPYVQHLGAEVLDLTKQHNLKWRSEEITKMWRRLFN